MGDSKSECTVEKSDATLTEIPESSDATLREVPDTVESELHAPPIKRVPHLHKLEKKHSSGDLHSRLKTRKLLGVGETDDGDVHRSKLSQILGHSDQLYIRLPPGLRIWQVAMAIIMTVMALWAFLFPRHLFTTMYEGEYENTLPIRLYGVALVCLSLMYWYTVNTVDKDMIRLLLLCSILFFTLHTIVMMWALFRGCHSLGLLLLGGTIALINSLYHWGLGYKICFPSFCRSTSKKEGNEKNK
ncbi:tumor protein p53-inducible protein 11 isoform X2 [Magallana gigas]|uniref:tumor protein p53-inducible protein 11 isoform X1 n=2 Tax=Magallana gigas TaxID=29159 RepID=UPI0005C35321|eukprot:XP_011420562.1 PREDICTED: tumor protein p53-inducible protein 11 isoform X1 [Crassostrea gigas]